MTAFRFASPEEYEPGTRTVEVPAYLVHKRDLLDFLARAFPLPSYFGHNWDALEECLRELDWLKDPKIILAHHDVPLGDAPAEQRTYLRILAAAASPRLQITFPTGSREVIEKALAD